MDIKLSVDNRFEIKLCDSDIINPDEIEYGDMNGRKGNSLFVLHDHGYVICAVWSGCLQDAIDEAVDNDKMERYLIDESDYGDYGVNTDEPSCTFLGNDCKPHDIETLGYVELTAPVRSNCAEIEANTPKVLNWHVA